MCVLPPPKAVCKLDNRIAALAVESLCDGGKQEAHAFRDEGALEKSRRILVFGRCLAGVNGSDIRSKFGLKERAFQHVGMRNSYFAPGFHILVLRT